MSTVDDIQKLRWTAEVTQVAPLGQHQALAAKRLREMAQYIESLPSHVFLHLIKDADGQPTGGCQGAPYENGELTTGWKGLWTVQEVRE